MRPTFIASIIFCCLTSGYSQSINIDNQTTFRDGIYATFEDFLNNQPSFPIESYNIKWKDSPFFHNLKMGSCKSYQKGKMKKTDMHKIWGVCVGGVPYIQFSVGAPFKLLFGNQATDYQGTSSFTRIRILGNICHFNIEDTYPKRKYARLTKTFSEDTEGKMIRTQRLLKLSTGKVYKYDEYVLSQLIKDDVALCTQFKQETERPEKLFLYLQKYNERNPVANTSILARQD